MILDKANLTALVKPYKASTGSKTLVVTLAKFFTDKLDISLDTDLIVSVDEKTQEIKIRKLRAEDLSPKK